MRRLCYTWRIIHHLEISTLLGINSPEELIARLIALLIGMTIHEFAHNYVAYRMGDPVPAREGRLTLNPLVHINWLGFLMFALVGFGILGQAPISPYRMRNPRWGFLYAVAAGPISNLLIAVVFGLIYRFLPPTAVMGLNGFVGELFFTIVWFNLILFLFNLIPLFPLDGWHIVLSLLPPDLAYTWQRHQQTSQYLFFGVILLSFVLRGSMNPINLLITQPAIFLLRLITGL